MARRGKRKAEQPPLKGHTTNRDDHEQGSGPSTVLGVVTGSQALALHMQSPCPRSVSTQHSALLSARSTPMLLPVPQAQPMAMHGAAASGMIARPRPLSPKLSRLPPLVQAPIANVVQSDDDASDDDGGGTSTDLPPFLAPLAHQEDATPLYYSEAMRQMRSILKKMIKGAGAWKQCVIAINATAMTTCGKMVLLSCMDHTGFDPKNATAMANLKHLKLIEEAVRSHHGFIKLFDLVFEHSNAMTMKGMNIVSTCTGEASATETSNRVAAGQRPRFCMNTARKTDTSKSSITPAYIGESAIEMEGVVFDLKTYPDNSQGADICVHTCLVLNQNQDRTVLRFLTRQNRIIDMSK